MSSLLQFNGEIKNGKVGLLFQVIKKDGFREIDVDTFKCSICGKDHSRLFRAWRKPVGMFGPWVVFRYNGEEHVPDLSIPINIEKLPKDAKVLDQIEAELYWHS